MTTMCLTHTPTQGLRLKHSSDLQYIAVYMSACVHELFADCNYDNVIDVQCMLSTTCRQTSLPFIVLSLNDLAFVTIILYTVD